MLLHRPLIRKSKVVEGCLAKVVNVVFQIVGRVASPIECGAIRPRQSPLARQTKMTLGEESQENSLRMGGFATVKAWRKSLKRQGWNGRLPPKFQARVAVRQAKAKRLRDVFNISRAEVITAHNLGYTVGLSRLFRALKLTHVNIHF
jgi:hypothetical protein